MGIFDSIGSALFGDGGESEIRAGMRKSNAMLDEAEGAARPYLADATSQFDPYTESGQLGQEEYNALMGVMGPEARAAAYQRLSSNPLFAGQLTEGYRASDRATNAMGAYGTQQNPTGVRALAGQRVLSQTTGNWLDRYRNMGSQGLQASGQRSNALTNQGNFEWGVGTTRAGKTTGDYNALATAGNAGVNNLLNLAGSAAKGYGAYVAASDIRLKRDIERIGELPSGLPVYRFRFKDHDEEYEGVMAHEAQEKFPHAVATRSDGYLEVDYARIR